MRCVSLLFALTLFSSALALPISPEHVHNQGVEPFSFSSDWQIETVSHFGGSSSPDIAINSVNRPHVLYCPPGEVWMSSRNETGWNMEMITETVGGGLCGSMDLGPDDTPHIFFVIPPPGAPPWPHHATKENDSWILRPVTVCRGGDISVDTEGEPHIACFSKTEGSTTWEIRHVTPLNDSWDVEYVDTIPRAPSSGWISIALDSMNNPHLLYYTDATGEVRYAFKENGTWNVEVVDTVGNLQYTGKHGSLVLDDSGNAHAVYMANVSYPDNRAELRYSIRTPSNWSLQVLEGPPGMKGRFPTIVRDRKGMFHLSVIDWNILNPGNYSFLADLRYATLQHGQWSWEAIYAGYQYIEGPSDYHVRLPDFATMAVDSCGNPHVAFYLNWIEGLDTSERGVRYATKGEPCPPEPEEASVSLDIDPDTLNLKSKGRWITAYLIAENASVYDMDISSIRLQDTLQPERSDYQDDVLMLKFNRQEFKNTVAVGESIEVKITGKWEDGSEFEAYDHIRVIDPGKK